MDDLNPSHSGADRGRRLFATSYTTLPCKSISPNIKVCCCGTLRPARKEEEVSEEAALASVISKAQTLFDLKKSKDWH